MALRKRFYDKQMKQLESMGFVHSTYIGDDTYKYKFPDEGDTTDCVLFVTLVVLHDNYAVRLGLNYKNKQDENYPYESHFVTFTKWGVETVNEAFDLVIVFLNSDLDLDSSDWIQHMTRLGWEYKSN